jgi:hypothetical protein
MPWNPAVLEQRIGRIHRIGQTKNVTVLNFISIDTIESRMLDLIGFKSGLAQGILDGGEDSIFMSDAEHGRFMKAVEEIVTVPENGELPAASITAETGQTVEQTEASEAAEAAELAGIAGLEEAHEAGVAAGTQDAAAVAAPEALELITRGVSFFADLSRSLAAPGGAEAFVKALSETDPDSGKSYLKIPVENPAAAAGALSMLASMFSSLASGARAGPENRDSALL